MSGTVIPAFIAGPEMLILVFVLIILFFGPKKIPQLARSTGEATKEWKKGREELEKELEEGENAEEKTEVEKA